jgi:hypothetical protein
MPRTRSLKWSELKLGAAAVVALALASALVFAVGGQGGFFWQRYPLHTRFADVSGLKPGAIVRHDGGAEVPQGAGPGHHPATEQRWEGQRHGHPPEGA